MFDGLVTDKTDPKKSFVMNTRMPAGTTANVLSAIKVVDVILTGECKLTADDVRRAGGIGRALKNMIGCDNGRYYRLFDMLRRVQSEAILTHPDIDKSKLPDISFFPSSAEDS